MLSNLNYNCDFIGKYDDIKTREGLTRYFIDNLPRDKKIVVLCVGSDRSTGDSLGPLVGSFISGDSIILKSNVEIWGTLENPLQAKNINKIIRKLEKEKDDICTLVVDASLDSYENVGNIRVSKGPVQPKSWVRKNILQVGDFYINMVVNISGFKELQVLQSTKLSIVLKGADVIADSIVEAISVIKK